MKKITLLFFVLFSFLETQAQVSGYTFSQNSGTYTPITGGTVLGTPINDDQSFNANPIGFSFRYNGVAYTQFSANSNGFVAFGPAIASSYFSLSTGTTNNVAAAFNEDLQGIVGAGELSYLTEGTAPNRTLTVQWKSYRRYTFSATEGADDYNFQIKLSETSNLISFVYGNIIQNPIDRSRQVGLRGNTNTDFNNRETLTDWSATTAGTTNTATCTLTSAIRPSSGLTFIYTPTTCEAPSTVTASALTTISATISWPASASIPSNGYEYFSSTAVTVPTTAGTATTGLTTNLTGLMVNTVYNVFIRSNCGGTFGPWNGPFPFRTLCNSVTAFSQNFDTNPSTGVASPMPDCWDRSGTTGSSYVATGGVAPGSAPNRLFMVSSGTTPTVAFAHMPIVSNIAANTHRLKFKGYSTTAGRTIDIGYLATPGVASSFTNIQTITFTTATAASAIEYFVTPNMVMAGTTNLSFRLANTTTGQTSTVYLDDVAWEPIPAMVPVCSATVTAIPNATCGNFSNTINWSAVSGADGYLLSLGTSAGGTQLLNNANQGSLLTYSFTGNPNTTYFYKITPFNAIGNALNCAEQSFTTFATGCFCDPVYTSGKTDGDLLSNVSITGTTLANNTGTDPVNPAYTFFTGQPNFTATLQAGTSYNLNVTVGTFGSQNVAVWIDYNDNFTFEPSERVGFTLAPIASNESATFPIVISCNPPLGTHRMRVRDVWNTSGNLIDPCATYGWGETEDYDVTITAAASCPQPSNLTAVVTNTTANLSWVTGCAETMWDVHVTTVGGGLPTMMASNPGLMSSTLALTALPPSTSYDYYVRAVCSTTDSSAWTGPFTFSTNANPPANDLCANPTTLTVGGLFTTNPVVATNVAATASAQIAPTCAFYQGGDLFYSIVVPASGSVTVASNAATGSTILDTGMELYSGTCGNLTLIECDDDDSDGNFSSVSVSGRTPGEVLIARFWEYGNDTFNTFLVSAFDASLSSSSFDNSNFSFYPNPVKDFLNLNYTETISKVSVLNLLGQQVKSISINATSGKVDFSNLASGAYIVKVSTENGDKTIKVIKE